MRRREKTNIFSVLLAVLPTVLLLCYVTSFAAPVNEMVSQRAHKQVVDSQKAQKQAEDSLKAGVSVRTNLVWDLAAAEPNLGIEFPLGKHWSVGANAGLKAWPRYLAWDWDQENPAHWRNFAIVPELRYYFKQIYEGWFVGADVVYTHYNVGSLEFPWGAYSEVKDHRLQGDFAGLGLFAGHSWWLGRHWRLEAEAGLAAGYNKADQFECKHCGAKVGSTEGVAIVPKLGVNLAYNPVRRRTMKVVEALPQLQAQPQPQTKPQPVTADTVKLLPPPTPVAKPRPFRPVAPEVEEWKGVAGQLAPHHPVLKPSSEYVPYTPDRILRKEEGALYVFFELDKSQLKRSFTEPAGTRDNGPVLDEIIQITSSILSDTTSSVSRIQIVGLASIEGPQPRNIKLADARAKALQAYIQERIALPDSLFETVGGGEAWSEFRDQIHDLVLAGGGAELSAGQLQQVLDIMDAEPNPDKREKAIKQFEGGAVFAKLRQHVLRDQRNSGYIRVYFDYVPDAHALTINTAIEALGNDNPALALEILDQVKEDSRSLPARATALFRLGRSQEAVKVLKAAAETNPAAKTLLEQWESHQQAQKAYDAYRKALTEYNNNQHIK